MAENTLTIWTRSGEFALTGEIAAVVENAIGSIGPGEYRALMRTHSVWAGTYVITPSGFGHFLPDHILTTPEEVDAYAYGLHV